ncbi:calmodulin-binding transcription activator [Marchantia polymorpha subsp. ruderalis]|uniref:CG-1 domain-containing protein n=2 Tax=Marchantia polymorpha TaxID=3197 RepID=A0A176WCI9_MARPO|nr:hypothetical protein AXG93_3016s1380 [Marchantia polymorpha subsp. ruderalis]PTQ35109.1 hypothetical protein MARPO_0074s0081 [Marchantia polymorpha]BBN16056.1 hypothetical protein Mp_7g03150 [Marchantia polymorpha subsp. ruderalis]|eukprot:PTQ35109.1 hypothetical protein MARPO_0074s0081 [Marchantia polymorpha]
MASMTAGRPRNLPPQPEVDVRQIIHEAQTRWLRPVEVCEILRNYRIHNFKLNPVPPTQPQSGSLFLFDRKALRYFRKDGHNWRKKKDGKTVREAHERLKAGSVDVLHCYYAHGEDNVNFQRRCYWMLDPSYEHIVLVHYREVTENNRSCIIRTMHDYNSTYHPPLASQHQHVSPTVSVLTNASLPSSVASPETVEAAGASLSPELDEAESAEPDEFEDPSLEIEGDQSGLQPSLLEQLGNQPLPGAHSASSSNQWPSLGRTAKNLGVTDGQFAPLFSHQDNRDFKPSFADLQQQRPQRMSSTSQSVNYPLLQNYPRDVGSIRQQFADMLDSPGPYPSSSQRSTSSINHSLDLSVLTSMIQDGNSGHAGNGAERFARPEVNSPPDWAGMLRQVTTPSTRRALLEGQGLNPGLGQSPHGKDTPPVLGTPISPKGIVDALSPRNLGRAPQTTLEANLRAVTEKEVLKEAEEKAQAQRTRWQTTQLTEPSPVDSVIHRNVDLSGGAQQMSANHFIEPDTLEHLVRSGHSNPDSFSTSGSNEKGSWMQQAPQQNEQPVHASQLYQNGNLYDHQSQPNQERVQHENLQPIVPPPHSTGFSFMDHSGLGNGDLFSPTEHYLKDVQSEEGAHREVIESYKKLDSFGRWMTAEIASDIAPYLMVEPGAWDNMQQMQMGGNLDPSPTEQCFNISDFSPEWGSSTEETKVLITGTFVGSITPTDHTWACMFGEIEVPAELVEGGALRCKAPKHEPGRVSFYITRSDRFACSQVREFEYRSAGTTNESTPTLLTGESSKIEETAEELRYKVRFARMLMATTTLSNCRMNSRTQTFKESEDDDWRQLESMLEAKRPLAEVKEQLIQLMFKRKLQEWLKEKSLLKDGKRASVHDDQGWGVSHFSAALGYVWSIRPTLNAEIPINFRDEKGWTALHWAAYCGREEVVCALLEAGASPNCATYCNKKYPQGQYPADLASERGHNGIAAFLSEKALTARLCGLNLEDGTQVDENAALLAADKAVAQLARRSSIRSSVHVEKDHEVLQTSLLAVRNATQAAALIQDANRQASFRRRMLHLADDVVDEYGLSQAEVRSMLAAQKIQKAYRGHQKNKKLHLAATAIQRKFRGWKGRKDFQTFRQRIIKLQAHVRGRLVRKQFRKILWSVSIVEKVVLRWLRRRNGLRGFRSEFIELPTNSDDDDDLMREGRHRSTAAVEKDVRRVQEMAREKKAREQYNRLHERISKGEPYNSSYPDHGQVSRDYMVGQDSVMTTVE